MLRSLYSGISGLKNHQVKMDVLGNNIANVNTTGFKRSRVTFSTMLSQTLKGESSADTATPPKYGGTNAMQIGLGSNVGSIDQIMTQGSAQSTGKDTDMMIQGNGFFVLSNAGSSVYSRAGAFSLDNSGNLIDPGTGALVQGFSFQTDGADVETPSWPTDTEPTPDNYGAIVLAKDSPHPADADAKLQSFAIDQNGVVTGVYTNAAGENVTYKIAQIAIASFNNEAGLLSLGGNFYSDTNSSGQATIGAAGTDARGTIVPNTVEMSNVDLSQEFTDMIVTQRGFQANSRVITVSDSLLQELIDLKRG